MGVQAFIAEAQRLLATVICDPGTVLYSSVETLCPGDFYFLGLNPGGTEPASIAQSLNALPNQVGNAYVDEVWENRRGKFDRGQHPLQKNARVLFESLGVSIERVCASNLIFSRSIGESGSGYPHKAWVCWPVHQLILAIVQPRAIFAFGRQPFEFLYKKLNCSYLSKCAAGHGVWTCRVGRSTSGPMLFGLPHLSRYSLSGRQDVVSWLRNELTVKGHFQMPSRLRVRQ